MASPTPQVTSPEAGLSEPAMQRMREFYRCEFLYSGWLAWVKENMPWQVHVVTGHAQGLAAVEAASMTPKTVRKEYELI